MSIPRVYIAGPMTGTPDLNRDAFDYAAACVRLANMEPVNPHELHPSDVTWQQAMRVDIAALMSCDFLYLLEGWEQSQGARLEHFIATTVGVKTLASLTVKMAA